MPNHGQNTLDKLCNISKKAFLRECVEANCLQLSTAIPRTYFLSDQLGTHHQFQTFKRFSWNFLIWRCRKSYLVSNFLRKLVYSFSGDNNLVPFILRQRKFVPKSWKVLQVYSLTSCRNFLFKFHSIENAQKLQE